VTSDDEAFLDSIVALTPIRYGASPAQRLGPEQDRESPRSHDLAVRDVVHRAVDLAMHAAFVTSATSRPRCRGGDCRAARTDAQTTTVRASGVL
jgi:hypothetical protein